MHNKDVTVRSNIMVRLVAEHAMLLNALISRISVLLRT